MTVNSFEMEDMFLPPKIQLDTTLDRCIRTSLQFSLVFFSLREDNLEQEFKLNMHSIYRKCDVMGH